MPQLKFETRAQIKLDVCQTVRDKVAQVFKTSGAPALQVQDLQEWYPDEKRFDVIRQVYGNVWFMRGDYEG